MEETRVYFVDSEGKLHNIVQGPVFSIEADETKEQSDIYKPVSVQLTIEAIRVNAELLKELAHEAEFALKREQAIKECAVYLGVEVSDLRAKLEAIEAYWGMPLIPSISRTTEALPIINEPELLPSMMPSATTMHIGHHQSPKEFGIARQQWRKRRRI